MIKAKYILPLLWNLFPTLMFAFLILEALKAMWWEVVKVFDFDYFMDIQLLPRDLSKHALYTCFVCCIGQSGSFDRHCKILLQISRMMVRNV